MLQQPSKSVSAVKSGFRDGGSCLSGMHMEQEQEQERLFGRHAIAVRKVSFNMGVCKNRGCVGYVLMLWSVFVLQSNSRSSY